MGSSSRTTTPARPTTLRPTMRSQCPDGRPPTHGYPSGRSPGYLFSTRCSSSSVSPRPSFRTDRSSASAMNSRRNLRFSSALRSDADCSASDLTPPRLPEPELDSPLTKHRHDFGRSRLEAAPEVFDERAEHAHVLALLGAPIRGDGLVAEHRAQGCRIGQGRAQGLSPSVGRRSVPHRTDVRILRRSSFDARAQEPQTERTRP